MEQKTRFKLRMRVAGVFCCYGIVDMFTRTLCLLLMFCVCFSEERFSLTSLRRTHPMKRRTYAVGVSANSISATVADCPCTFRRDKGQLTCLNLDSFRALSLILESPVSWCNGSSSVSEVEEAGSQPHAKNISDYRKVRRLFVSQSNLTNFNFDALKRFDSLNVLVMNGNEFGDSPPATIDGLQLTTVVELDLTNNGLTSLPARFLATFPRLQVLHLAKNNLTKLEERFFATELVPDLRKISLKDNRWRCQNLVSFIDWLRFNGTARLEESDKIECESCEVRQQVTCFLWVTLDNFIERCPGNCTCTMIRANIAVDCRNKGYNDFPHTIPYEIGILYMQNNSIRSLQTLKNASLSYHKLRYLYIDNNSIDSINGLDGTNFEELTTLHISGNRLRQLSVHVFEKLFSRNLDEVTLGNNPWNCECNTVVPFGNLLNSRRKRFKDIDQIRCSSNSSLYPNEPIHKLSAIDFCSKSSSIHPLDIINVILATLIFVIVSKLLYDYRVFKRTGQIPVCPYFNFCSHKSP